ncbi:MAG: NrdR family transcriptional regulator [Planctomycetota bacterium]
MSPLVICPYCGQDNDKVIDSRASDGGLMVRRRRECLACARRYTTYERVERATSVWRSSARTSCAACRRPAGSGPSPRISRSG